MRSVALLDGGLGQEIYRRAHSVSSPLWSVAVMQEQPELVSVAMPALAGMHPWVGGYANAFKSVEALAGGGSVDALEAREDVSPQAYMAHLQQWLADGATVVGGCCGITPAHIQYSAGILAQEFELIRFSQLSSLPARPW